MSSKTGTRTPLRNEVHVPIKLFLSLAFLSSQALWIGQLAQLSICLNTGHLLLEMDDEFIEKTP
jgi:hypothetical protein